MFSMVHRILPVSSQRFLNLIALPIVIIVSRAWSIKTVEKIAFYRERRFYENNLMERGEVCVVCENEYFKFVFVCALTRDVILKYYSNVYILEDISVNSNSQFYSLVCLMKIK